MKNNIVSSTPQSKTTIIFAAIFLGIFGVDRYMLGYRNWWLKAITFGGMGIWIWIDLYKIIRGSLKMANGTPLL